MRLELAQAPTGVVLTLPVAKNWLRVTVDAEDDLIGELVTASTSMFEEVTGRQVLTARWVLVRRRFPPDGEALRIPRPPLASVGSVQYRTGGRLETMPEAEYRLIKPGGVYAQPGSIVAERWPDVDDVAGAVRVTFTAGVAASAVPPAVKQAVRHLLGSMYELRGPMGPDKLNVGLRALLDPFVVSLDPFSP